jgi:hypothetical protein
MVLSTTRDDASQSIERNMQSSHPSNYTLFRMLDALANII